MAKVLLVDEDERDMRLIRWVLEEEGHSTTCAQSAEQAIRSAKGEPPDLVLFDSNAPRAGRSRAIENLREVVPTVHVIDVATYREASGQLVKGADRELLLPFDAEELLAAVHALTGDP